MREITLSKRLQSIASYVSEGSLMADIGSDHAYLPCYVCLHDNSTKAIAGEINTGPYVSAKKTVERFQLSEQIDVRLGDGLSVLSPDEEVTLVTISGMGGSLIKHILQSGKQRIPYVRRIIVQPNTDAYQAREWLSRNNFCIIHEEIMEEKGHIYEMMVADKVLNCKTQLTSKQLMFGPLLLQNKTAQFYKKWTSEQKKRNRILEEMKKATCKNHEKIKQFELEIKWIKEVLENE